MEKIPRKLFYIYRKSLSRAEWMNGICLIWSRGRLISPSLPVGDDRYLNLSSQKRPTGRNLGGNRLVRRSGTTSRGTVLIFRLLCKLSVLLVHAQLPSFSCSCPISFPESTFPLSSGTGNKRLWDKAFQMAFSLAEYLSMRNRFRL